MVGAVVAMRVTWVYDVIEHFASIGFPSLPERGSFGLTDDFRGYLLGREERKKECQGAMEGQAIHPKNMSAFVNLKVGLVTPTGRATQT